MGQIIPITRSPFRIGREQGCHLRPASEAVSKRHCALVIRSGKILVRDHGSTNGTFVNDCRVKGERELHPGDSLRVGPLAFRIGGPRSRPAAKAAKKLDEDALVAMLLETEDKAEGEVEYLSPSPAASTAETPALAARATDPELEVVSPGVGRPSRDPPTPPGTADAAEKILEKYVRRPGVLQGR
jgi:pSer/pThr/pTyr-binding forkhead associated (FHA) protein